MHFHRFLVIVLSAVGALILTACYTQVALYKDPDVYEGKIRYGFETNSFKLCGSATEWQFFGNEDEIARLLQEYEAVRRREYDDVYVRVKGAPTEEGRYGHMNQYFRLFRLVEFLEMRRDPPRHCE